MWAEDLPRAQEAPVRTEEEHELPPPGTIGAILVRERRISAADAQRIVATQRDADAPFGETAIRLGLATLDDVQFALARQFSLPRLQEGDTSVDPEVLAAFDPGHAFVASLRMLRGQIGLRALDATPPTPCVAILGGESRAGRSYVAANLAVVFAQLGTRTLLIDADLVCPRQHTLFRVSNRAGLSSILAGRASLSAVNPIAALPGFAILPAGPVPPNPHDLLARPALEQLLRHCEADFDVILIDTPAWNLGGGARSVAAAAGSAVLLVQPGKTGADDAGSLLRELTMAGSRLLGAVMNGAGKGATRRR